MGTSANAERRQVPRRPFRGTVELGLPDDPEGYEADAVDLSIGGMALRTSLLPDKGSELSCRFALEDGAKVAARGEVIWAKDSGKDAGEFGLRFTQLEIADEDAIRRSFDDGASPPARHEILPPAVSPEELRARLHIPGMNAPLRARVRTEMDDVIVLGSDLSFLKIGESVEIERTNERSKGSIEDVTVEIDPTSRIARLVLTVTLAGAKGVTRVAASEPPPNPMPMTQSRRPAASTAVLTPESDHARTIPPPPMVPPMTAADEVGSHDAVDDEKAEAITSASPDASRTPPAWLVATMGAVRSAGLALVTKGAPMVMALMRIVAAAIAGLVARARGREIPRAVTAGGLRRQQPAAMAMAPAMAPRRRYGLYILAAAGIAAIVFALATSGRDPRPHTPRPQVAVATPPGEAAPATTATSNDPAQSGAPANNGPAGNEAAGSNEAPTGSPTGTTVAADTAPSDSPAPAAVGSRAARTASTHAAPANGRRMPSDLVAAARSRSADVSEAPTLSIGGAHRANVTSPPPAAHAPAAAPTVATAHVLGNPALHVGTVLRLRMDGPINAISGGAAGGNTLVIRMPGRRAVDHAAPLVHQDTRLVNAGVFNRAGNSELTLRFRDGLPAYAARAHGNALEIVLAPPAHRTALPAVVVRAPAHAPTQRAHVPASRAAHIPRRR